MLESGSALLGIGTNTLGHSLGLMALGCQGGPEGSSTSVVCALKAKESPKEPCKAISGPRLPLIPHPGAPTTGRLVKASLASCHCDIHSPR